MNTKSRKRYNLSAGIAALLVIVIAVGVAGYIVSAPETPVIQGEAEAAEYRISGKVPGRIGHLLACEGQEVHHGDTLVVIDSPEVRSKLAQAMSMKSAADAQNRKTASGARQEQITAAYQIWQQAAAGEEIAKKTFDRMQRLYLEKVISAQKWDEATAQYKAAKAVCAAAKAQYDLVRKGAGEEDRATMEALSSQAAAALEEVESYLGELYLTSPVDGTVSAVYPMTGELVGQGAPIMTVTDLSDMWITFNIREDMLNGLRCGDRLRVRIPALGDSRIYDTEVYYICVRESYATWRATKESGSYDAKTFEVRARPVNRIDGLRPGMTAIVEDRI